MQKLWTHAKKSDPCKNVFDPRIPRKTYNPLKMLTQVKNVFDPRNPRKTYNPLITSKLNF